MGHVPCCALRKHFSRSGNNVMYCDWSWLSDCLKVAAAAAAIPLGWRGSALALCIRTSWQLDVTIRGVPGCAIPNNRSDGVCKWRRTTPLVTEVTYHIWLVIHTWWRCTSYVTHFFAVRALSIIKLNQLHRLTVQQFLTLCKMPPWRFSFGVTQICT